MVPFAGHTDRPLGFLSEPAIQGLFQFPSSGKLLSNHSHRQSHGIGAKSCLQCGAEGVTGPQSTSLLPKKEALVRNLSRSGESIVQQQIDEKEHRVVPCLHLLETATSGSFSAETTGSRYSCQPHGLLGIFDGRIILVQKPLHLRNRKNVIAVCVIKPESVFHAMVNDAFIVMLHGTSPD